IELRATAGLASIYGLRMFGMFIILPVFAFYAEHLPGGNNYTLVGVALGAYGLTQAILQIPFGWLSDRIGRKPVIYIGLILFAMGSFIAASADDIYWVIFGRIVQGAGAISAAVMALTADLTREEHRTKAMAAIGMTIGTVFALSLIIAPGLNRLIGVPGIFAMTGILALLAMIVVYKIIPNPLVCRFHSDTEASAGSFRNVLHNPELLRLNFGVFTLHATLMALWLVIPLSLREAGLVADDHWQIYLPVLLISMVLIVPTIIYAEKKVKLKPVFAAAVSVLLASQGLLALMLDSIWGMAIALLVFFTAFNLLEASLPSLISKIAPVGAKGTAIGVYSSIQFLGAFTGATAGGYLYGQHGGQALFAFSGVLLALWLVLAFTMKAPAAVRTKMYHVQEMETGKANGLSRELASLPGVHEALVLTSEGVAYLKVDINGFDETRVVQLLGGKV
ncbi:MAG: MFS transporter, partial [Nitrosomonadaceae bacterium]